MRIVLLAIIAVVLVGCAPAKPKVVDPCATAPKTCFGKAGQVMSENPYCNQLTACFAWEARAK